MWIHTCFHSFVLVTSAGRADDDRNSRKPPSAVSAYRACEDRCKYVIVTLMPLPYGPLCHDQCHTCVTCIYALHITQLWVDCGCMTGVRAGIGPIASHCCESWRSCGVPCVPRAVMHRAYVQALLHESRRDEQHQASRLEGPHRQASGKIQVLDRHLINCSIQVASRRRCEANVDTDLVCKAPGA